MNVLGWTTLRSSLVQYIQAFFYGFNNVGHVSVERESFHSAGNPDGSEVPSTAG
jgi:hypothetical protein